MSEFFAMGGYGGYVWSAYAVFAIVLSTVLIGPQLRRRRVQREIATAVARQARRGVHGNSEAAES